MVATMTINDPIYHSLPVVVLGSLSAVLLPFPFSISVSCSISFFLPFFVPLEGGGSQPWGQ